VDTLKVNGAKEYIFDHQLLDGVYELKIFDKNGERHVAPFTVRGGEVSPSFIGCL